MKKIIKSMNLPRPLGTPSLRGIVLLLIALAFAACTQDEPLSDNNPTNPLAGTLHIGTITVDGVTTTRAIIEGSDTEHGNTIPVNQAVTALTEGDQLLMLYSFSGSLDSYDYALLTFNGSTWSITDSSGNPIALKPTAETDNYTWAGACIWLQGGFDGGTDRENDDLATAIGLNTKETVIVCATDQLIADHEVTAPTATLTPGDYRIDKNPGSPDLGRIEASLAHKDALLRLPVGSITITGYEGFGTLQELIAVVEKDDYTYHYRFTPVTIGSTDYWQAIVSATDEYDIKTLTGFIAIIGPEDPATTPGNNEFNTNKGDDGNILTTTNIPMKPITLPLAGDGIEMVRNTRYPLTLTLSPHTATVKVGSSVPGWGTEEEKEIIYWNETDREAGIRQRGTGANGAPLYEVVNAKGLEAFASHAAQNLAANCKLVADIDLTGVTWTPIGTDDNNPYRGTFDGGGHTISHLTVDGGNGTSKGFFGDISDATVKNLTLAGGSVKGRDYIGSIAGAAENSTIANCHNRGVAVTATTESGKAGGIVGQNYVSSGNASTLTACTNSGSVVTNNKNGLAGGIVGESFVSVNGGIATLNACVNTGKLTGGSSTSGIVGWSRGSTAILNACYWLEGTATNGIGSGSGDATKINKTADATTLANIASALTATATGYTFTVVPTSTPADGFQPGTVLFTVTETATP